MHDNLKARTQDFAKAVLKFSEIIPQSRSGDIIARQLIRFATSVGANYRAACRAKSRADFIAKMGIVEEEADESIYWMELLTAAGPVATPATHQLLHEAGELKAIVEASIKTARRNAK